MFRFVYNKYFHDMKGNCICYIVHNAMKHTYKHLLYLRAALNVNVVNFSLNQKIKKKKNNSFKYV